MTNMMTTERLLELADIIRNVDGDHTMGAAALADAIADSGYLWRLEQDSKAEAWEEGKQDYLSYATGARKKVPYPTNPYPRKA